MKIVSRNVQPMWCQDKWWMSLLLSVLLEKNYDYEMSYKMHSNIQYLCEKCGTGNSLAKCRHLLTIAGCPLYFDTLNSWHSWHFTDTFNIFFNIFITQSLTYTGSWESCLFEACNSYHFCISKVGPSEKNIVHNENGVNQKDNILLKPYLYVIP